MRYLIEPRDRIYVKGYGLLSFPKNISKNGTKGGKNLNNKYSPKLIDSAKKSTTNATKTASKRSVPKNSRSNWSLN